MLKMLKIHSDGTIKSTAMTKSGSESLREQSSKRKTFNHIDTSVRNGSWCWMFARWLIGVLQQSGNEFSKVFFCERVVCPRTQHIQWRWNFQERLERHSIRAMLNSHVASHYGRQDGEPSDDGSDNRLETYRAKWKSRELHGTLRKPTKKTQSSVGPKPRAECQ